MHTLYVVHLGAVEVLEAERIDEHLDAVRLEALVHVSRLIFEVEVVLESGAAAANDSKSQSLASKTFGACNFLYFFCRDGSHGNHGDVFREGTADSVQLHSWVKLAAALDCSEFGPIKWGSL